MILEHLADRLFTPERTPRSSLKRYITRSAEPIPSPGATCTWYGLTEAEGRVSLPAWIWWSKG